VSRYQKGKTNVDFTKAIDSDWQWQLASAGQYANLHHPRQITMPGHMPFLPPNQQHQRLNTHHTKLKISECLHTAMKMLILAIKIGKSLVWQPTIYICIIGKYIICLSLKEVFINTPTL